METFYTIIKIAPNPISGDNLSIGLLVRNSDKFWLHFSDEKKTLAKRLLDNKSDFVDYIIKQITHKVEETNKELSNTQTKLFDLSTFLSSERVAHLNVYCNGLLRFTEPAFLNDVITENKFEKLFQLLIDKTYQKIKPEVDEKDVKFHKQIDNKLIKRVQDKVHTQLDLTPEKLPGLYFNFNIDCIGKNGALIGAKAIPFHKKYETIDKELGHYFGLISILQTTYKQPTNADKFFVIGDEPSEINSKEHRTWENIKQNPSITLLYSEESNKVADVIEEHNAKSFLQV
jgi:hypothetical protein